MHTPIFLRCYLTQNMTSKIVLQVKTSCIVMLCRCHESARWVQSLHRQTKSRLSLHLIVKKTSNTFVEVNLPRTSYNHKGICVSAARKILRYRLVYISWPISWCQFYQCSRNIEYSVGNWSSVMLRLFFCFRVAMTDKSAHYWPAEVGDVRR